MTFKKLLTMAAAIMIAGSMWAQKDVTSTYITNAKLSDGTNGWTVVNFNTPKKGNNTEGYASESYAGWDALEKTEYSMTQKITLPAGNYTLVNYSFYREGQNADTDAATSRAVLKVGDKSVAIKTLGSIKAGGYANSQAEGANVFDSKMYRNALDFKIDADGTEIEIGITGTFTVMRSWIIAGMFELINNDIEATMDSPFDVTGYITNPGFEYRDMTGWTLSESGAFGTQNNDKSFKRGGYYAEKWQASGALTARSMSQKLSDLPAGYYQLKVNLGGNGTYVDLNGKTANWTEDKDYTVGYVLSENEDLTITAGKTAEGTANWIHFDNFKLYYCGDVNKALTDVLAKVTEYKDVIPTAAYTKLQSDVAAYDKSYSDVDELLAAIGAVQALYDAADVMKTPYATAKNLVTTAQTLAASYPKLVANATAMNMAIEAATDVATLNECISKMNVAITIFNEWLAVKASAEKLAAVPNDNPAANTGFVNTLAKKEADVQAVSDLSDAAVIGTTTNQLKSEILNYVADANPTSGNTFDVTILVTNPSFENNFTGWEQSGMGIQGNDDFGKDGSKYAEAWQPDGTKKVSQSLTEMPKGHYTLTVRVKARGMTSAKVFAGSEEKKVTIADEENDYTVEFSCIGDVKIGVEGVGTKAGSSWFALDNFRLTYTKGLTEDEIATLTLKQAIEDAKTVAAARPVGDVLFAVPTADKTTLNNAITDAQTVYDNTAATTAEKADAASKLNDAADTYKAVSINKPEAGKAYFLKQKNTSLYMNLTDAVKITAEPYAIQFIANGDGWTIASAANAEVTAGMAGGDSWSMSNNKVTAWKVNWNEGTYTIQGPNGLIGSDNTTAGSSCYGNKGEANNGLWIIEEAATLAVAAANEYATFVAPFDVTIPSGVKAYTVDGVTGAELNMTEVTTTIKANTPVVLQATTDVNEKFYGVAATGTPKVGLLTGVYTDTPAPVGTYVLQNQGEGAKFYLVEAGKQPTVKAGHAYLTAPSAGVKAFGFDAIATAITELTEKTEATEGVIYNLQGQQLNSLQRGINIVNGKKVLVK